MLKQREMLSIRVDVIDCGHRCQMPSDIEIDQMAKSIEQDGLLMPIGVQQTDENSYRLVHGATRLSAMKKLGRQEVMATILEGTDVDTASAEIVENLTRRHLDKDHREKLAKAYLELRTAQRQDGSAKELNDDLSHNSSQKPKTHAKAKVEGAKRGRPMTAEGQAKKEIAAKTGQSLRNVQRITSEELKRTSELAKPRRAVAPGDTGLREFDRYVSKILDCVLELERKIGKFQPERFAATTVTTDKLAKAGKFLTDLANLNKSDAGKPTKCFVPQGNGLVPADETGRERKAENAEQDAAGELAGVT